jgi:lipid-binding SYLF domain-containing protein
MTRRISARSGWIAILLAAAASPATTASADTAERELVDAAELIRSFTDNGPESIPAELLARARGIAVVPGVIRGGFILGARRGSGVISIRMADGSWSNPAFVTLTGGSIGWQIGAETTDVVLIFANENAIRNISTGKFTLGGEATAIAGPLRKQASSTVTFQAEVYGYVRSRGLYAGAAFQGARLDIDEALAATLYAGAGNAVPLGAQTASTPEAARRFLLALEEAVFTATHSAHPSAPIEAPTETRTFPLPD